MEKTLTRLFDAQKFHHNPRLSMILADVEHRYDHALSDDDLTLVNAAGDVSPAGQAPIQLQGEETR